MNFRQFKDLIPVLERQALPGLSAQMKMMSEERRLGIKNVSSKKKTAHNAAVLVFFYPDDRHQTHFVLILRAAHEKDVHSGQVGFPGGQFEPGDGSLEETALRETEEEVGVPREKITVVKALTEVYIPPSNFMVWPFIGYTSCKPEFIPMEEEVERVIEAPLAELMNKNSVSSQRYKTSYAGEIEVPVFRLADYTVWGATAMMLAEVRQLLSEALRS